MECLKETVAGLATNAYEGLLSVSTAALEKDLHAVDVDPGLTATAPVPRECSVDACLDEGAPTIVVFLPRKESFYGSPPPPQLSFNEIAGFETGIRPYLPEYGAPCHPDVIVR